MAYIGNTVQNQGFAPAIDYFSGNGSTVTFTLSRPVASVAQVIVAIDNVIQNPSSAFTVSGNAITFTSAPLSGTNNIWVEYTSLITTYAAISQSPSVVGDITASGGYLAVGNFGNSFIDGTIVDYVTGNGRITTGPADGFTIYNGGTSSRTALMTLDASGNMGVGTTSPAGKFNVGSGRSFFGANSETYSIGVGYTQARVNSGQTYYIGATDSATPDLVFSNAAGTERMRIDSAGNVGIGTSSPTSYGSSNTKFVITGSGRADAWFVGGANAGGYAFFSNNAQTSSANAFYIGQGWGSGSDNIGFLNNNGAYPIVFATSSTERMRITSAGELLVNATTKQSSGQFEVSGNSDGTNNPMTVVQQAAGSTSRTSISFYRVSAAANVGAITTTNTATAYVTSSDYRLKENIAPMTGALATVQALKPVTYKWKIDGSDGEGFIAHELAEVCPHAVTGEKDSVDAEGNPVYQGIDTSFLVATLTAAIQEQQAIIEDLKARIQTLESK